MAAVCLDTDTALLRCYEPAFWADGGGACVLAGPPAAGGRGGGVAAAEGGAAAADVESSGGWADTLSGDDEAEQQEGASAAAAGGRGRRSVGLRSRLRGAHRRGRAGAAGSWAGRAGGLGAEDADAWAEDGGEDEDEDGEGEEGVGPVASLELSAEVPRLRAPVTVAGARRGRGGQELLRPGRAEAAAWQSRAAASVAVGLAGALSRRGGGDGLARGWLSVLPGSWAASQPLVRQRGSR